MAVLIHTVLTDAFCRKKRKEKKTMCANKFYCVKLMVNQRKRVLDVWLQLLPFVCLLRKQSKIHTHMYNSSLQCLLIISSHVVGMCLFSDLILLNMCVKWCHNCLLCVQPHPCVCWLVGGLLCQQDYTENCRLDFYCTRMDNGYEHLDLLFHITMEIMISSALLS